MNVFLVHLLSTWYMVGVIWLVQLAQYPLFDRIDREKFPGFEHDYSKRVGWVVIGPMLLELGTGVLLCLKPVPVFSRGEALAGLVLIVLVWISTWMLQVPRHGRLLKGYDEMTQAGLVRTNWIRTVLWTGRGLFLVYVLVTEPGTTFIPSP